MINALDSDNILRNQNGTSYDLNLLANMSAEELENLSVEELEGMLGWIQGYAQEIRQQLQGLNEDIKVLTTKKKTKTIKRNYEQEIRSVLTQKSDVTWIQEFIKENEINEHTDIKTIITLINRNSIVKSVIMNYVEESLSPEEKNQLAKIFSHKSPKEVNEAIKENKIDKKTKNILKKLWLTGLVLWAGIVLSLVVRDFAKEYAKNNRVYETELYETEQGETDTTSSEQEEVKNNRTHEETGQVKEEKTDTAFVKKEQSIEKVVEDSLMVNQLQQGLQEKFLGEGVTYDEVCTAVNNIPDKAIRIKVMNFLKENNVIEVQKLLGMKENSQYTSNKATGIIDLNTLQELSDPLFSLSGDALLQNPWISQEIKDAYTQYVQGRRKNNGVANVLVDKTNFKTYLIDKDGKVVNVQTHLSGADIGKPGKFRPYPYYNTNQGLVYHRKPIHKDTPEWEFLVKQIRNRERDKKNFKSDGPAKMLKLVPIDEHGNVEARYEYQKYAIWFHPTYAPYEQAMESETITDNAISHGCLSEKKFGKLKDNLTVGESKVYICHYTV